MRSPEDIYSTTNDSQKLSYFYSSNRIISSSHIIRDFFKNFHLYIVEKQ